MAEAVDYKQIGSRPVRPDGLDKVTGRAQFGADTVLPNMIHGKVLRSPHAHAKILSIDVTEALAIPGVFLPRLVVRTFLGVVSKARLAVRAAAH